MRPAILIVFLSIMCGSLAITQSAPGRQTGVLLLAHGGQPVWNANVRAILAEVDRTLPADVAFGMADRSAMAEAIVRLRRRGVTEIVAVPLFVSSYSSVLTSTEYLLGLRADKPREVELFARMRHGASAADGHADHAAAVSDAPPATPIDAGVPIRMTSALDAHPLVRDIVVDRALAMSDHPEREAVVLVAHGPNDAADNDKWLATLAEIARAMSRAVPFAHIAGLTLRDDAPAPVRQAATEALRSTVASQAAHGRRVLIVPVLLSYGGIEKGLRDRLAGLRYVMSDRALAPDPRLVDWVISQALGPRRGRP